MDTNLERSLRKHVPGRTSEVLSLIETELEGGATLEDLPYSIPHRLGLSSLEAEAKFSDGINRGITEYKTELYRAGKTVHRDAQELLFELQDVVRALSKELSNAYFFNLGRAEYSEQEIDKLQTLLDSAKDVYFNMDFKSKIPGCGECGTCILHNRYGCKRETYSERFERWTGE